MFVNNCFYPLCEIYTSLPPPGFIWNHNLYLFIYLAPKPTQVMLQKPIYCVDKDKGKSDRWFHPKQCTSVVRISSYCFCMTITSTIDSFIIRLPVQSIINVIFMHYFLIWYKVSKYTYGKAYCHNCILSYPTLIEHSSHINNFSASKDEYKTFFVRQSP